MKERYVGHEEIEVFLARGQRAVGVRRDRAHRTAAAGDCVVAEVRFTGRGLGSGVEVTIDAGHLVRFRDGLIREFWAYASWDEALAAADPCLASAAA